jgi:hypothetical protein
LLVYDKAPGVVAECVSTLTEIGLSRLPQSLQHWHAVNRPVIPPGSPILGPWREALAALERGEVDTPLPELKAAPG